MHIRRLVKSGAASHTISLPKEWINNNKLKKGDIVYITEENNNLCITNDNKEEKKDIKEITINIDEKAINTLRRETISAYINNYQIFNFIGKSLNSKIEEIRKILDNFLALEIVEQTSSKLVAKDFLNLKEFSLDNTIRRMDMLTRSMIDDSKKGEKESKALYFRDFEVDKLFFLVSRLIRAELSSKSSRIDNVQALSAWWLAKNLELISDNAKKISSVFSDDIKEIYGKVEEYYLECAKAYFKKDKTLADKMIDRRIELLEEIDKMNISNKHLIKELVNNSRNVAKIMMDSND